jgi:hypothetical protein
VKSGFVYVFALTASPFTAATFNLAAPAFAFSAPVWRAH